MNISLDKKTVTDGLIKVKLTETDYQPKVEEKVKEYARKANIKGFRQGKVPSGVIRKMFGKSILVEEVNHMLSHSVSNYIKENKIRILGDPIPNEEKAIAIDWDSQKDFEFEFQIGMVDDFNVDLSKNLSINSHPIEVTDKIVNETVEDLKKRFGQVSNPETSSLSDVLYGEIVAVDGLLQEEKKSSYIEISKVAKKEQAKFVELKNDDEIDFDIEKILSDENLIAQAINISVEEAKGAKGKYTLKVSTISHTEPAQVDQDLFDKSFGKDVVKSEEEFLNKIKETIADNYNRETNHLLDHEIQHLLVDKVKINMPESFLKDWLKKSSEGQVTDDVLTKEFDAYSDSLKWDLIKNKIAEDHKINVESPEVKERARKLILDQFGGEGVAEQLGNRLDGIIDNYLVGQDGKGQNFNQLYSQIRNEKILQIVKDSIAIKEKKVSFEEFQELASKHNH